MKLALVSLATALIAAPAAFAQSNIEVGGSYSHIDVGPADVGALTGRATWFVTDYLGLEGEASIGVKDDNVGPGKIELDHSIGAFGVLRAPVTERFDIFGRLGYARSELSASAPGLGSASADFDGVAYGVGGRYFFTDRVGLRGDFTKYEGDNNDADVISIGAVVRF
ncbi:porin family protein [Hyphomonas sp.]|uniref:porin family protein n=1 Tax=Hyphomonas sp. TaxID=87 RepID=UPI00391DC39C